MTKRPWKDNPDAKDFLAAERYLSLAFGLARASDLAKELTLRAETIEHFAKDIMRASQLPLLPESNHHVAKNLRKIDEGVLISPILCVRTWPLVGELRALIIADGYHRLCAAYHRDEDLIVRLRLV